ncbi:MAG: TraV family lipoprotein [Candidatus Omnitrophica bacterium]|nr:TraV family lipoprotein [Candidatus Omnitrophota bacterium]
MRFIYMLLAVILLSGCETFKEPDFDKPLIPIPENKPAKSKEDKVWVEAKTSRIWINPHVDENGDYEQGHYKYTVLENGHWRVNPNEIK